MAMERRVLARKGQHLVALPAAIRRHLRAEPGVTVYWRITRGGEAVISRRERPARGPEVGTEECPSCEAREKVIARLRARDVARDRTLYAEGHSAGYLAATARLTDPRGPSATRALGRRVMALHTPSRSARRKDARAARVEVQRAPVLDQAEPTAG